MQPLEVATTEVVVTEAVAAVETRVAAGVGDSPEHGGLFRRRWKGIDTEGRAAGYLSPGCSLTFPRWPSSRWTSWIQPRCRCFLAPGLRGRYVRAGARIAFVSATTAGWSCGGRLVYLLTLWLLLMQV